MVEPSMGLGMSTVTTSATPWYPNYLTPQNWTGSYPGAGTAPYSFGVSPNLYQPGTNQSLNGASARSLFYPARVAPNPTFNSQFSIDPGLPNVAPFMPGLPSIQQVQQIQAQALPPNQPAEPDANTIALINGDVARSARVGTPLEVQESGFWATTGDTISSFFGGDPDTPTGLAANIAGGIFIVGDVGSLIKNGWRATGLSSTPPNALEASLSALGLGTELAVGVGETVDVPVSTVRAVVAMVGDTPFARSLIWMLERGLTNANDLGRLATALPLMIKDASSLRLASEVLTTNEAMLGFVRMSDELGEAGVDALTRVAMNGSIEVARASLQIMDQLNPSVLNKLKAMSPAELEQVMGGLGRIVFDNAEAGARAVSPDTLAQMLNNVPVQILNGNNGYGLPQFVSDLDSLRLVPGFSSQINYITSANSYAWQLGRIYEVQAAADIARMTGQDPSVVVTHLGKWVTSAGGKTDIDVIADGVYFQVKRGDALTSGATPTAWRNDMQRWVDLARADGGDDVPIRYFVASMDNVPTELRVFMQELQAQGLDIDWIVEGGVRNW